MCFLQEIGHSGETKDILFSRLLHVFWVQDNDKTENFRHRKIKQLKSAMSAFVTC